MTNPFTRMWSALKGDRYMVNAYPPPTTPDAVPVDAAAVDVPVATATKVD